MKEKLRLSRETLARLDGLNGPIGDDPCPSTCSGCNSKDLISRSCPPF